MKIYLIILTTLLSVQAQYLHDGYIFDRTPPHYHNLGPQSTTPQPVNYEYFPSAIPTNQYLPPPQVNNGYHYPPSYGPPEFTGYSYGPPCYWTLEEEFIYWKDLYNKTYNNNEEQQNRKIIFLKNAQLINAHNDNFDKNNRDPQYQYQLEKNEFTDMEYFEVIQKRTGYIPKVNECETEKRPEFLGKGFKKIPINVQTNDVRRISELCKIKTLLNDTVTYGSNWMTKGAVTRVKNQGGCGSCWAFATTGVIEAQNFIKTKKLVPLSEQNLIDCVPTGQRKGCDGGSMTDAFKWVADQSGITIEDFYPYRGNSDGKNCQILREALLGNVSQAVEINLGNEKKLNEFINSFYSGNKAGQDIIPGNEEDLIKYLDKVGPVAVGIYLTDRAALQYKTGVFFDQGCTKQMPPNHAVLLVGYGTSDKGGDFWLVKNSWGEKWGEDGFMRIARGKNNHCGIATFASFAF